MPGREYAERLWTSMAGLGFRRLLALGIIGATVFALVTLGGVYLSRADMEILYAGLDRADVGRVGAALNEAGIGFDVNSEGNTVMVRYGQAARARMLLAEKGLPNSSNAGYELFDELGSLGLTSFMQEVTRVRALEGEIARTIQLMKGVIAARVHIVLPDKGSFRRDQRSPSASVVLRMEAADDPGSAQAIRHLVSAAVPGLAPDQVTVLNTDGALLASGGEDANAAPGNLVSLEKMVGREVRENISQTLVPYLGLGNFQISVAARLNTDKKQSSETIFDPESRVERSRRVIKLNEVSQNMSTETPTTVEQDLPEEQVRAAAGEQASAENERREELTNYEISSKTITTVSDGYSVENLSVAVLINKAQLAASLGPDAEPAAVEEHLEELRRLIGSAAGFDEQRGDTVTVTAVEFNTDGQDLEPVPALSFVQLLAQQSGTVINAATILLVALLLIWFGLRPATKAILARPEPLRIADSDTPPPQSLKIETEEHAPQQLAGGEDANLIEDLTNKLQRSPQKRLAQIVDFDEQRAAAILRQWLHQDQRA